MDERQKGYAHCRTLMLRHLMLVVFFSCGAELLMFFYLKLRTESDISAVRYYTKYVIGPTAANLLIIGLGNRMIQSKRIKEQWKDEIPLYCITAVAFILANVHVWFSIMAGIFVVPILVSVIYGSKQVTQKVTLVCLSLAFISFIIPMYDAKVYPADNRMNRILSILFIIGTYLLSSAMLYYVNQRDEERRQSTAECRQLKENLKRDAMTGLFNHVEFYRYLDEIIQQDNKDIHVAVIDIDNFKKVNDTYGHEKGNDVLMELSELLTRMCGADCHISRYGGEEFAVIFVNMTAAAVYDRMEAIRKKLEDVKLSDMPVTISISVGIAAYRSGLSPQELFEKADEAMYLAKHSGKNQIQTL